MSPSFFLTGFFTSSNERTKPFKTLVDYELLSWTGSFFEGTRRGGFVIEKGFTSPLSQFREHCWLALKMSSLLPFSICPLSPPTFKPNHKLTFTWKMFPICDTRKINLVKNFWNEVAVAALTCKGCKWD